MTSKDLLFSIIIPTYNSGATLRIALESIIEQTNDSYEVLIIDGKSLDNTLEIVTDFKLKTNLIRFISEPDKGIYDAMNKGIQMAKGRWLYFMGADDRFYDAHVLQGISEAISLQKADVLYGDVYSKYYGGRYDGIFDADKLSRQNICHQAIFFKTSVFKKTGYFNLNYTIAADWDHNLTWFFDSKIEHHYIDFIIAHFADGGFSYTNNDYVFEAHKPYLILTRGFFVLPFHTAKRLCKQQLEKEKTTKRFRMMIFYHFYHFIIRVKHKLKHLY